ncbi:bacteriochlorophyll 4-vinyl reductase [Aestuariivirga sp.]|uniref:bacteriochlorophyll 4-vinyl reductase n=1 Tax=Aestuariivirga sp. TaxID=2650926 RepID=UPI0035942832
MNSAVTSGRIGPNAVIRLVEALDAIESRTVTTKLFRSVDLESYVVTPPDKMVAEDEVTVLHRKLRHDMGAERAASVSWIAGLRTADYLLANRIPKPVQRLLKILPRRIAGFILLKAIGSHAWTFAGTSRFTWRMGPPIELAFEDCPLCRYDEAASPCCQYYAATFEHLFRELIDADARVVETCCIAAGAEACRFEIRT